MKEMNITLATIEDVKKFVALTNDYEFDTDLVSGRYKVDAKSIMGIFSLDLSKPLKLLINGDGSAYEEEFIHSLSKFAAK